MQGKEGRAFILGSMLETLAALSAIAAVIAALPTIEHYTRRVARALRKRRH